jgi:hypothetical protein
MNISLQQSWQHSIFLIAKKATEKMPLKKCTCYILHKA